jgi:hypothetical protein
MNMKDEPRSDQEVKTVCSTILNLVANGLQHIFEKWVECCKKCTACQGRYFEKENITTPPHNSDLE